MKRILLVEDDISLGNSISDFLEQNNYSVIKVTNLKDATENLNKEPHLILLDWGLPDGVGIDWLRNSKLQSIPVIMLTARADLSDKILGLEMGCRDYITKPFEPRELLARIRVQLRGNNILEKNSPILRSSGIEINTETYEVRYFQVPIELTKIEYKLLKLLLENPRKVFSRESLLNLVWEQRSVTTRTIDVHIGLLRQKFKVDLFETLHSIGYRFVPASGE